MLSGACLKLFRFFCLIPLMLFAGRDPDWLTRFEKSYGTETSRLQETMDFFKRLAQSSPYAKCIEFGISPEGRPLTLFVIAKDRNFTPSQAEKSGKPVVLIQGCIHAGESEGKDAAMLIARDLLIDHQHPELMNHLVLLFLPIFNVDGHERMSEGNRINQYGPKETGWRVTATRLNLNRDFLKADAPEMRTWLKMYHAWKPHFFFDCHTTDGKDFQYVLTYNIDTHPAYGGAISAWAAERFLPQVVQRLAESGLITGPYAGLLNEKNPSQGLLGGVWRPMLSNSFATLLNRAGFLIEAHSLKPYTQRVEATRNMILLGLQQIVEQKETLIEAVRAGDRSASTMGKQYDPQPSFPIAFRTRMDQWEPLLYRGYQVRYEHGKISGGEYPIYTQIAENVESKFFNQVESAQEISPPLGYLIPRAWQNVIQVLQAHGIPYQELDQEITAEFETFRFSEVKFRTTPYEGRHLVTFKAQPVLLKRTYHPGDIRVLTANPKAKLIMYLLEPQCQDALIGWGFFNQIFEDREYFESYVMEPLAQEMATQNPLWALEFERKVAQDSAFSRSPRQRLQFFYERSKYYDGEKNLYPIARITNPDQW